VSAHIRLPLQFHPRGGLFGNELPTRALTSGACCHGTGDVRSPIGSQLGKCQVCSALAARPPTGRCPHRALAAIEGILPVSSRHSVILPVFPQLTMRQTFDLDGIIPARVLTRRICCQRRMMPSSMLWALLPRGRRGYAGSREQYSIRQIPKGRPDQQRLPHGTDGPTIHERVHLWNLASSRTRRVGPRAWRTPLSPSLSASPEEL
jgi:hypothetical protein